MNMCVGEKIELTCPPHLAYGEHGTATIPGNSTLIFEVELIKVEKID
jgi:FKBP-type peptidyl-prolyl cis-trans isomerase FkpA